MPFDWRGLILDSKQGGSTIEYRDEAPHIRKMFQEQLATEGADFNMPEEAYRCADITLDSKDCYLRPRSPNDSIIYTC